MSFSEFTSEDRALISKESALLMEAARKRCRNSNELDVVRKAFEFANEAHNNVRRRSGDPYVIHSIEVALIVVNDIGLGYKSIAAALLHDVVEDTDYTPEDIRSLFGDKIASLVEGLTKIKTVLDNGEIGVDDDNESLEAESFKKILITMGDDVRVVLIKLADRLHNCRTLEFLPERKRDRILSDTMFIFIPLAHRLGLYGIKSEMENIWMKYRKPEEYNDIADRVKRNRELFESEIELFTARLRETLDKTGVEYRLSRRIKTPYSIWRKMEKKGVPFEQIYDLYAVRIIFSLSEGATPEEERRKAYEIYLAVTEIYREHPSRTRDWIRHPKSNGYEALHCTLMSDAGIWVEVQIRSKRMDDMAEKGIAAHWSYKRNGFISESGSIMDRWLAEVQGILSSEDLDALELLGILHDKMVCPEITVFTPKGEQRNIEAGSTALDFAFHIHSDIGFKAIAAKVNLKLVPLSQTLSSGDRVEIITAASATPKPEWIDFVHTRHARARLNAYFKEHEQI